MGILKINIFTCEQQRLTAKMKVWEVLVFFFLFLPQTWMSGEDTGESCTLAAGATPV